MINTMISTSPHNCINEKLINGYLNCSLLYNDDIDEYLDDLDEICLDIRDKGYQTKIKHKVTNVSQYDRDYLIECKNLIDPIEYEKHPITEECYYQMKMYGIDYSMGYTVVEKWTHEKSFISEVVYIDIENRQEVTHIEKEYSDGKTLEWTKYPHQYQLVTSKETLRMEVDLDDDIKDCAERCKYLFGADRLNISRTKHDIQIKLTKFKEIETNLKKYYESNCY